MDSERITVKKKKQPNDFSGLIGGLANSINYKMVILIFLVYILLNSDVFINRILSKIDGTTTYNPLNSPNTKGHVILGLLLSMCYILIDSLIKSDLI